MLNKKTKQRQWCVMQGVREGKLEPFLLPVERSAPAGPESGPLQLLSATHVHVHTQTHTYLRVQHDAFSHLSRSLASPSLPYVSQSPS